MPNTAINIKKREGGLDLLRIFSALAVILVHVNAIYFMDRAKTDINLNSTYYVVESIINILTRFSVPSFVMISGAFVLNNDKNADWRSFYCKSLYKIFLPVVIVAIGFLVIDEVKCIVDGEPSILVPIKRVVTGDFYNLWYMYMLVGLYMLTPFLIKLKQQLTEKEFCAMSVVLNIWAVGSQAFSTQKAAYAMGVVFAYTGYYTLGSVLMTAKKKSQKKSYTAENILLLLTALVMYAVTFVARYKGITKYLFNAYINFFSPTITIAAICIFKLFLNLNIKKDFSKLSGYTFYMYLFHTLIYKILHRFVIERLPLENELAKIAVLFVMTTVAALICAVIYQKIWDILNKMGLEKKWFSMQIWSHKEE